MALDNMPKDPMMLLSFVNTRLRDDRIGPDELCKQLNADVSELFDRLASIGYAYSKDLNRFV
ncbi:MAG: DUF4250 domain-containing protein [Wujia sp.]